MEKLFEDVKITHDVILYDNKNTLEQNEESSDIFGLTPIPNRYRLHNGFSHLETISNNETKYKENYGNPFAQLFMSRRIATVTKDGDKVSIKIFKYTRARNVGRKYFKVRTHLDYISYNIRTNALYVGKIINYHLKRKCVKKCSRVLLTSDWLGIINLHVNCNLGDETSKTNMIESFVNGVLGPDENSNNPKLRFYKHFLQRSGAKLPNNWDTFICVYPQPTKKVLQKVKFKYIDSYMSLHKLSGDKLKKCLHLVNSINLDSLKMAYHLFGEKYILSKPHEDIVKILQFNEFYFVGQTIGLQGFTKKEINCVYEVFMLALDNVINMGSFTDHIRFKHKLSGVNPVKWRSNTVDEFNVEHYDWSEKVSDLSNCRYDRYYGPDFKNWAEQIIPVNNIDYYPVLLTNSSEYNFESITQNNCVRTYIQKPSALIISLRENSNTSTNKLTIEYNLVCNDWETKDITLVRVQTRRKSNMQPGPEWDEPLRLLDLRIKELCKQKLFTLPKITVTFRNTNKVESDLLIGEDGFIQWDNRAVQMGNDFTNLNYFFDDLP